MFEYKEIMDKLIAGEVAEGGVKGASALVLHKGKEIYYNAFGFADAERGIPMQRDTIIHLYSMTKPVTAAAVMILAERGELDVVTLGRGYAWMDAGTVEALSEASEFVRIVERREGIHISSPEEIAYHNGWIDLNGLRKSARAYGNSPYGQHLQNVADGKYIY